MSAVKGGNMMKIPYTPLRYTNYALHVRNAGKKKKHFLGLTRVSKRIFLV